MIKPLRDTLLSVDLELVISQGNETEIIAEKQSQEVDEITKKWRVS